MPANIDDHTGSYNLILDDKDLFYIYIGEINVSPKKAFDIASNYLSTIMPVDYYKDFFLFRNGSKYTAAIPSRSLIEFISNNIELFEKAVKISSPFCELCIKNEEFTYTDGTKVYKKDNNGLTLTSEDKDIAIKFDEALEGQFALKGDFIIPLVKRSSLPSHPMIPVLIVVAVCFTLFLTARVINLEYNKRILNARIKQLEELYNVAGVAGSRDPYGVLISKSSNALKKSDSIINYLNNISKVADGTVISSMSYNGKTVKLEGNAVDFVTVERMKTTLEKEMSKKIIVEESKQVDKGVKFIMRFEP